MPKKPTDPRSQHPAIQAVRGILKRYPTKDQYSFIIDVVGETPDREILQSTFADWIKRDYNPTDLRWLDWYAVRKKKADEDREYSFGKLRKYFG